MIPTTNEEKDAFLADVSAAILTTLAPAAFAFTREIKLSDSLAQSNRNERIAFAIREAQGLLDALAPLALCKRFEDGTPIDPRALDPALNYCAHGTPLDKPCAACEAGGVSGGESGNAGESGLTTASEGGDGAALAAFNAGLHGGAES